MRSDIAPPPPGPRDDEIAQRLSGKLNEALRHVYQQVIEELRPEATLPAHAAVTDPKGDELAGAAPPDAPRSRFAEGDGVIYVNAQHADYLSAKSAQLRGDARPMLVYQMALLWKEYLLATDPYASAARQGDDLAGLVSRSQKYLPARL